MPYLTIFWKMEKDAKSLSEYKNQVNQGFIRQLWQSECIMLPVVLIVLNYLDFRILLITWTRCLVIPPLCLYLSYNPKNSRFIGFILCETALACYWELLKSEYEWSLFNLIMCKELAFMVKSLGFCSITETMIHLVWHNISWLFVLQYTDKIDPFELTDWGMFIFYTMITLNMA